MTRLPDSVLRPSIAATIDRKTRQQPLTAQARARAINIGLTAWQGDTGVGQAAQVGIDTVTKEIFRK